MSSVGEDLAANLRNYKIQLQQVEAALTSEPDNEEFLKLKEDLEEVITLTKTLMNDEGTPIDTDQDKDLISHSSEIRHNYRSGDIVLAPWSQDGQFYEAEIEDIVSDGQCNVTFKGSAFGRGRVSEVCLINLLKPLPGTSRKKLKLDTSGKQFDSAPSTQINTKQKRIQLQQHREYLKRKQQKKQSRLRDLEEEREKEKNKWKQFNVKAVNRHLKGATTLAKKQSIFKSPDTVEGKVGVGTCGIAGKPMTNFVVADKYKRGTSTAAPSSAGSSASRNPNLHSISNIR